MSADQATEKLGEYLEKVILNLTDKNIGNVKTGFKAVYLTLTGHRHGLVRVAAEKNGVPYKKQWNEWGALLAIVAASEKRGSSAGIKIKNYTDAWIKYTAAAKETDAPNRNFLTIAKNMGPNPT